MWIPKFAAVLGIVGVILLFASAVLGATSLADWILDAAQAFIVFAALLFETYVFIGILRDALRSSRATEPA
jgi:hypothetical protein